MRGVRIHMQAFIHKHSQNTGEVKKLKTGMARARHKSNVVNRQGRLAENVIRGGQNKEIIQVHDNNPGRGK